MSDALTPEIGPQYPRDPAFTARMRFHQSWYRANVLQVPYGTGPKPRNKTYYGNMLRLEDGKAGKNFLTEHIFTIAQRRLAEKKGLIDEFRLLCNLLSSQPMCFNLFGPLVDDRELAADLLGTLLPGEVERVERVVIEHSPDPAHEYLNDRTAFDAFIEYTRPDGKPAFAGVETKLTEEFTPKSFSQEKYWEWTKRPDSPWPEASWEQLLDVEINQLWRRHLLAEAMLKRPNSPYAAGRFLLVYHPEDKASAQALRKYRSLLKPEDQTFTALTLEEVVSRWQGVVSREADREWLSKFRRRYLELSESEDAFQQFRQRR